MSPNQRNFAAKVQGNLTRLRHMLKSQRDYEILEDNKRQAEMLERCVDAMDRLQFALHSVEMEYHKYD